MLNQIVRRLDASALVRPAASLTERLSWVAMWGAQRVAQHWCYRSSLHQLVHLSDRDLSDIGLDETPWQGAIRDEARTQGICPSLSAPAAWSAPDFVRTEHRAFQTAALKAKARGAASDE